MTETPSTSLESRSRLEQFIEHTHMESAYQMLLLLLLLHKVTQESFSLDEAASRFALFYDLRRQVGLFPEKQQKTDVKNFRRTRLLGTIRRQPYPILFRAGLLSLDEETQHFTVPSTIQEALQPPPQKERIRALAVRKLAAHYTEPEAQIDDLVRRSIEAQEV